MFNFIYHLLDADAEFAGTSAVWGLVQEAIGDEGAKATLIHFIIVVEIAKEDFTGLDLFLAFIFSLEIIAASLV